MWKQLVALAVLAISSSPSLAAEPVQPTLCLRAFHILTGQRSPCEADVVPVAELTRLLDAEDALILTKAELQAEKDARAIDQQESLAKLAVARDALRACEADCVPPPPPAPKPKPKAYEKLSFWTGAAVLTASVVTGIATGEDHPALWVAGGLGAGIMLGGAF